MERLNTQELPEPAHNADAVELQSSRTSSESSAPLAVDISIVIATYRRAAMVRDTLHSLAEMDLPPGKSLEILIVDNDSEPSAQDVFTEVAREWTHPVTLRYVHESRAGLSYARNRGIDEARGAVLVFLDDDVFVRRRWLMEMLDCLERTGAACVGGRVLVHWEGEPDPVLRQLEQQLFAIDHGVVDRPLRGAKLPGGGNAAFRREVFERGDRFAVELGRIGTVLLSGEDTEFLRRIRRQGHTIWYSAGAAILHRTGGERLTQDFILRRRYWYGISYAIVDLRMYGRLSQVARAAGRTIKLVGVIAPQFVWAKLRRDRAAEFLARCETAKQYGYLWGTLRGVPTEAVTAHPPERNAC